MIVTSPRERWDSPASVDECAEAIEAIESGGVLHLPRLAFELSASELRFLSPSWSDGKAKNISLDVASGRLAGARGRPPELDELRTMIGRFADSARALIGAILPSYREQASVTRTSLRTIEASTRVGSRLKDDRLLHVDAFPSRPNRGSRILRVFSNINPSAPRVWHVGESFDAVAAHFLPVIKPPVPGGARMLAALRITKSTRSDYDHIMLGLHDHMKRDESYQRDVPHTEIAFAPGSTWICFSDQVSHAVIRGQYMLEQTLQLPVEAMRNPERSPLRILERMTGRPLST
ncbi:MAG TPA: Kdo hydroxylase family protein [Thermoanaerobaculia bacterium]